MTNQIYCNYFLGNTSDGQGNNHVFPFSYGKILCCDNYDCQHGNNSQEKILIGGNKPFIGVCLSKGLKKKVEG